MLVEANRDGALCTQELRVKRRYVEKVYVLTLGDICLTARQINTLLLLSTGKTYSHIAENLGYSANILRDDIIDAANGDTTNIVLRLIDTITKPDSTHPDQILFAPIEGVTIPEELASYDFKKRENTLNHEQMDIMNLLMGNPNITNEDLARIVNYSERGLEYKLHEIYTILGINNKLPAIVIFNLAKKCNVDFERHTEKEKPLVTDTEKEILAMIARGIPYEEIAARSSRALKTIKNLASLSDDSSIPRKLGAHSLAHAIIIGFKMGYLDSNMFNNGEGAYDFSLFDTLELPHRELLVYLIKHPEIAAGNTYKNIVENYGDSTLFESAKIVEKYMHAIYSRLSVRKIEHAIALAYVSWKRGLLEENVRDFEVIIRSERKVIRIAGNRNDVLLQVVRTYPNQSPAILKMIGDRRCIEEREDMTIFVLDPEGNNNFDWSTKVMLNKIRALEA